MVKLIDTSNEYRKKIEINGQISEDSYCYYNSSSDSYSLYIRDNLVYEAIENKKISNIYKDFECIYFSKDSDLCDYIENAIVFSRFEYRMLCRFELDDWNNKFSLRDLFEKFHENLLLRNKSSNIKFYVDDDELLANGFGLVVKIDDFELTLNDLISQSMPLFTEIMQESINILNNVDSGLSMVFNFSEEIRTPCEQYLMYFSQFLSDLGVKATSEITHSDNATFFSVTPDSKDQALEVISNALVAYLSMPDELNTGLNIMNNKDIAVMQLESNILHFKSQLMLAQSIIQAKDATIQSLSLSNKQYQLLLDQNNRSDTENIIGNIVKVKEYDGKMFSVDLPKIVKNLKRILR
ncbi:hypothetical protein [Photobacterium kishitanii]|uniref:Uncharacterized protein n=1 Tax=Photobacterium kishitanii TaxID=318456 RepID=A0A2T3KDX1_9GAMM|nr:hypothetical protein [Photobacterium kishitanii]PSU95087.1 hypothetical protein C9J27_19005 [Photobacterium kishitanii]